MPTTANGAPYPSPSDAPNGPFAIQQLAEFLGLTPVEFGPASGDHAAAVTWTNGSPSGTFTAPPSGRVIVHQYAILDNGAATTTETSFRIYEGSDATGALVVDGTTTRKLTHHGTESASYSASWLITGLTAGATYFVIEAHQQGGGSGSIGIYRNMRLLVDPKL